MFIGECVCVFLVFDMVKLKVLKVMEFYGGEVVIVSEGLFGLYLELLFLVCNEEFLFLVVLFEEVEIFVCECLMEINFLKEMVVDEELLFFVVGCVGFLFYGLIFWIFGISVLIKGIVNWEVLFDMFCCYCL